MQPVTGDDAQAPNSAEYCALVVVKVLGDLDEQMRKRFIVNGVFDEQAYEKYRLWLAERLGVPKYNLLTRAYALTQDNASIHAHMRRTAAASGGTARMRGVAVPRLARGMRKEWYNKHIDQFWNAEIAAEQASGAISAAVTKQSPHLTPQQVSATVMSRTQTAAQLKMARVPEATALTDDERDVLQLYPTAHTLYPHQLQPLGENMCDMNTPAENVVNFLKNYVSDRVMEIIVNAMDDECLDYGITYVNWLLEKTKQLCTPEGKRTLLAAVRKSVARVQLVAAERGVKVDVELVRLKRKKGVPPEITSTTVTAKGTGGAWISDHRFSQ